MFIFIQCISNYTIVTLYSHETFMADDTFQLMLSPTKTLKHFHYLDSLLDINMKARLYRTRH